jgi:hypothetical protein
MKIQFDKLSWPNRIVLVCGLLLASLSYWLPRDFALHGAGGGTIGLCFVFLALFAVCTTFMAICAAGATIFCLIGGFSVLYFPSLGRLFSIVGLAMALLAFLAYVAGRLRSPKKNSEMKA